MLRSIAEKVAWMARATTTVVGLAIMLGLVFGVATTALGANGGNFILGQGNAATALTRLTGDVQGSAMQIINNNAGSDDSALNLQVQDGEAPMRVTSDTRVNNLNADKLDGLGADDFVSEDKLYTKVEEERGEGDGREEPVNAFCDEGDTVLGGGGAAPALDDVLQASEPFTGGWNAIAIDNGAPSTIRAKAICADFPPLRP